MRLPRREVGMSCSCVPLRSHYENRALYNGFFVSSFEIITNQARFPYYILQYHKRIYLGANGGGVRGNFQSLSYLNRIKFTYSNSLTRGNQGDGHPHRLVYRRTCEQTDRSGRGEGTRRNPRGCSLRLSSAHTQLLRTRLARR